jgi:hypothetical protein
VGAANGLGSFSFLSPPLLNGTRFSGGIFSEGRAAFWVRSCALVEGSGSGAKQSRGIDVLSPMKSSRLFLGVFAIIASSVLAEGTSLGHGEDGRIVDFLPVVHQYNASGELFRIQGVCKSACTLFLGSQLYYAHVFDHEFRSLEYNESHRSKVRVLTNPFL